MQTHSVRPPFSRVTLVIPPVFVSAANSQIKTTPWQLLRRRRRRRRRRYFLHRAIREFMRLLLCCCCCCTGAHPPSARAGWQTDTKKKVGGSLVVHLRVRRSLSPAPKQGSTLVYGGLPCVLLSLLPGFDWVSEHGAQLRVWTGGRTLSVGLPPCSWLDTSALLACSH